MTIAFNIQTEKNTFYFILNELKNIQKYCNQNAHHHYQRAILFAEQDNYPLAIQELRYAIKIEPNNSYYHTLLGVIHFRQNLTGMAKIYIRQALKFNPQNILALKYADLLKISPSLSEKYPSFTKATGISAFLKKLSTKKEKVF